MEESFLVSFRPAPAPFRQIQNDRTVAEVNAIEIADGGNTALVRKDKMGGRRPPLQMGMEPSPYSKVILYETARAGQDSMQSPQDQQSGGRRVLRS